MATLTERIQANPNEAAEQLLGLIRDRFDPISREARPLLDKALYIERSTTIERIRERIAVEPKVNLSRYFEILDEEAGR